MKAKEHFLLVRNKKDINMAIEWLDSRRSKYLVKKYPCVVIPNCYGKEKGYVVCYYE